MRPAAVAPGLERVLNYERPWLRGDIVGGISVAAYLIPQVMAYAEVAGLPPVTGLWSVLGAMVVYAIVGSSRQLSVGPESTTAIMTAAAIGPLAAGDPSRYAVLAAALALVVALWCFVGWVAQLGFLADLISKPVLVGYLAGVALIMIVSQLDTLIGVELDGDSTPATAVSFLVKLGDAHLPTLGLALGVLLLLFVGGRRFPRIPITLVVMLLGAAVVNRFGLGEEGVAVVGSVPSSLPVPQAPDVTLADLTGLLLPALGVAVVAFTDNAVDGRAFAYRGGYRVDVRQELLALGGANVGAGLLQGFPVSSSASRTAIGVSLGSQSQLHSVVAAAMVVLTLLFFGPVLASVPLAALAAVVIWAAIKLIDGTELVRIGRFRRSELVLALATTVGVLVVGVLYGVLLAVGLSILDLLRRVARPHDGVLGYVPGVAGMHDIDDYPDARQVPGLVVYRYDAPLFFANAEDFKRRALDSLSAADGDVEWFLLNFEANVHVDLTSVDVLDELRGELADRGVVFAMARVKWEVSDQLKRSGLVERIGANRIFATLPTAVVSYLSDYTARHGAPPPGVIPPSPPEGPIIEDGP